MLARFFQQILNSCGVVFRTFRAFFTRQFMGLRARVGRITSFSQQAARLIPKAVSSLAIAGQKPSKREDFVETKRLFVAKSFLVMLAVGIVVLGLLSYFVIWPWMVSKFFTAHFFEESLDLKNYTGKVIVYYDQQKTAPKLEGEMLDGLLQGEGREYDEAGRVRYAGSFVNGQYDGEGSLYEEGVLRYKGDFSANLYSGQGVAYYASGGQEYAGAFSQGLYEGEGTLYYENGQAKYKGQFSAGSFDGQGREYNEDGSLRYEGAFQEGVYAGEGKLRISGELQLTGQFENGEPLGEVSIYRGGKLNYQGEVQNLQPNGLGTLYASDGTPVYTGAMQNGKPDFAALLDLSGDDIRAAFAQAKLEETAGETGFSIRNAALGVTLFCSYKTQESDPQVFEVYSYNDQADSYAQVMPWRSAEEFEAQMQDYEKQETQESPAFMGETPFLEDVYHCTAYSFDTYTIKGWSKSEDSEWFMVQWSANRELPQPDTAEQDAQAQDQTDRLESLLQSLGLGTEEQDAAASQQTPASALAESSDSSKQQASATSSEEQSSAKRRTDGEAVVLTLAQEEDGRAPSDEQNAAELMDAFEPLVTYYLQAETLGELERQLALKEELLQAEKSRDSMGTGSESVLEQLESQVSDLEIRAGKVQVAIERVKLENAGIENRDYSKAVQALLQPPENFGAAAVQAAGGDKAAELALLDLELSWQTVQQAKNAYENAAQNAEQTQTGYKTGAADQTAQCEALCAESEAVVQLHEAINAYAMQILEFNTTAGGYLSDQYDWQQALEEE